MEYRVLELFSGIGGMHYAFNSAHLPGKVVAAMDINTNANAVYAHNHVSTPVHNNNIQSLTPRMLEKFGANMILMSPPCQPHTRVGHRLDVNDNRSDALQHICTLLPHCNDLQCILMENVKGFEVSQAREHFVEALETAGFYWREFILSPTQFGIPNTRHRYYCVARKGSNFPFPGQQVWEKIPKVCPCSTQENSKCTTIERYLDSEQAALESASLPEKVLSKRVWLMDIVTPESCNTMCFTKAYTHYSEGTGSVFTPCKRDEMDRTFEQLKDLDAQAEHVDEGKRMMLLKRLQLRYFTPSEVARLMSFPDSFSFPTATTTRQKYRLLGNSINVHVVSELIKMLCS